MKKSINLTLQFILKYCKIKNNFLKYKLDQDNQDEFL